MRLIDADSLRSGLNSDSVIGNAMQSAIDEQPTIEPETLPIVRQLRKENEKLKYDLSDSLTAYLLDKLNKAKTELEAIKMNPPVQLDGDIFDLAYRLAKVTAERNTSVADLRQLKMKNEVLVRLLSGERVEVESLVAATGWSFEQCCKHFELNRVAEWWSVVGKTEEERMRNGQKITCYFCLPSTN